MMYGMVQYFNIIGCLFLQLQTVHSGLKIFVRNRARRVADASTFEDSALKDLQR